MYTFELITTTCPIISSTHCSIIFSNQGTATLLNLFNSQDFFISEALDIYVVSGTSVWVQYDAGGGSRVSC